jgi:hypothetical protein
MAITFREDYTFPGSKFPHVQFVVSYDLQCEYRIGDRCYRVRSGAHEGNTRSEYYWSGVVPMVGTVSCRDNPHEFPPAEVLALFPGFVGARWNENFTAIEYTDQPADILEHGMSVYSSAVYCDNGEGSIRPTLARGGAR